MPIPGASRWSHPGTILVATDLSDLDRLLPFAIQQAVSTGANLILLHVLAASEAMAVDAVGMPYYDPAGAIDFAAKSLETCCHQARSHKVACDAVVREGNVAQQVLAASRQFHADRILLGTRSRSKMSKLLLGSVAEQVLRSANLPVMTVGPEAHLPVEGDSPERLILHATTLREASRSSAALACQIASTLGAKLVLLHVLPPLEEMDRKGFSPEIDSVAVQELTALATEAACGCTGTIEPHVIHGNPSIEILAEAAQRHASLIVLGATQRSALQNLTRNRTIYKILAHAHCPVLTLREAQDAKEEPVALRMAMHL
jgi:nucleotide-binding universal stress UspA family protein